MDEATHYLTISWSELKVHSMVQMMSNYLNILRTCIQIYQVAPFTLLDKIILNRDHEMIKWLISISQKDKNFIQNGL
jgi:hypothetical protein